MIREIDKIRKMGILLINKCGVELVCFWCHVDGRLGLCGGKRGVSVTNRNSEDSLFVWNSEGHKVCLWICWMLNVF